jgi:protein TonB
MPPKPIASMKRKDDSAAPVHAAPARTSAQLLEAALNALPTPASPENSAPQTQRAGIPRESVKIHTFEDLLADLDLLSSETPADAAAVTSAHPPVMEAPPPAEPAEELAAAKPKSRSARAQRIPLSLAVTVLGRVGSHNAIREEARTIFLLRHGAVLSLAARVSSGETLTLINSASRREAQCDVLDVQAGAAGKNQIEVEFRQPEADFWPVTFPAEDGEERGRKAEESQATPAARPSIQAVPVFSAPVTEVVAPTSLPENAENGLPQPPPPAPVMVSPRPSATAEPVKQDSSQVIDLTTLILADEPAKPDVKPAVKPAARKSPKSEPRKTSSLVTKSLPGIANSARTALEPQAPAALAASSFPQNSKVMFSASENRSGKKWVWLAVAASLVLAIVVGGTIYLRHDSSANLVPKAAGQLSSNSTPPSPALSAAQPITVPASSAAVNPNPASANPSGTGITEVASPGTTNLGANAKIPSKSASVNQPVVVSPAARTKAPPKSKFSPGSLSVSLVPIPKPKPAVRAEEPLAAPSINSIPGGIVSGTPVVSSITSVVSSAKALAPVPVGGQVQSPRRLSAVDPIYPVLARRSRIEGDVVIQADIDVNGKIASTTVVSGPGPLQQAALEALRKWRYSPGLLNGQPVASRLTVTVQFRLN